MYLPGTESFQLDCNSVNYTENIRNFLKSNFFAFYAPLFFTSWDVSSLFECVHKLNTSTTLELPEMKDKITQLHHYMHKLSDQFLSMETVVNSLFYDVSSQVLIIVHCHITH